MSYDERKIRVLELYSGIGGMHYSMQYLNEGTVIAAVDISPLANSVYRHNFPETNHMEMGIEGLSVKKLENLDFNMLLMSPPCQPFTRVGKKKDKDDPRTKSFFYLLDLLKKIKNPPSYILLENVKGFEESQTCMYFKEVLSSMSYQQQGFLISPKQLGIPNSRLRYYHLAVREPLHFNADWYQPDRILHSVPGFSFKEILPENKKQTDFQSKNVDCKPLIEYLEDKETNSELILSQHVIERYLPVMDVVYPHSTNSTCFTKSYGKYVEGTGSILKIPKNCSTDKSVDDENSSEFYLRYFNCREIANLMGFPPKQFTFPHTTTLRQRYRLLGNSLNVRVVSELIKVLLNSNEII